MSWSDEPHKCLQGSDDGTKAVVATCAGDPKQIWEVTPPGPVVEIKSHLGDYCLTWPFDSSGRAQLWSCSGLDLQKWQFVGGTLRFAYDESRCVAVDLDTISAGGGHYLYPGNCPPDGPTFNFHYNISLQSVMLTDSAGSECLSIENGETPEDGAFAEVITCDNEQKEKWVLQEIGSDEANELFLSI